MGESTNSVFQDIDFSVFSHNLRSLLDSKGMMAKDLAADINITPATISRYVTNSRVPELWCVYKIAKYFGVSIDWLLGLSNDKNNIYTPETREILDLYSWASSEDQAVVQTVLRKYRNRMDS